MERLILEQSSDEFYTSRSGLALAGACINRYDDLDRYVGRVVKGGLARMGMSASSSG